MSQNNALSDREFSLFVRLVQITKELDDCCPDVGMGPSWQTLAERAAQRVTIVDPYTVQYLDEGEGNSYAINDDDINRAADYCRRAAQQEQ